MKKTLIWLMTATFLMPLTAIAQKVSPTVSYTDTKGVALETKAITDGQAPLETLFKANPTDIDNLSPSFEWHFLKKTDTGRDELFVRYEENTEYTFNESGTYDIVLKMLDEKGDLLDTDSINIFVAESWLEFPNAFSPNGDGLNDIYQAKKEYKSIVEFHAIIINRWGQKLYEWSDPAGGWDGTHNGKPVKDGVYYVIVKARGGDGKKYEIRKDVNLLRKHLDKGGGTE